MSKLNNDFTRASQDAPQAGPAENYDFPKTEASNENITTLPLYDMSGTYSVGPGTMGVMIAIATKDYVFLYDPDWAMRGSYDAVAYPRDGSGGGSAVFPSGGTNTGDTKAGTAWLEAKEKFLKSLEDLGPGIITVENGGSVSGAELMRAADDAFKEQTRWKADLESKRAIPQSPAAPPPAPSP